MSKFYPTIEKQTGRKHHVWGVVSQVTDTQPEIAQCQVETCLRFKLNDLKPYLTLRQLLARYPDIEWL